MRAWAYHSLTKMKTIIHHSPRWWKRASLLVLAIVSDHLQPFCGHAMQLPRRNLKPYNKP